MAKMLNNILWCMHCVLTICLGCQAALHDMTLSDGVLGRQLGVSVRRCRSFCDFMAACASTNYFRRYKLCVLYDHDYDGDKRGTSLYTKPASVRMRQFDTCRGCSNIENCQLPTENGTLWATCSAHQCPVPEDVKGATLYGNKRHTGSRVMIKCMWSDDFVMFECLEGGSWSYHNLSCMCAVPPVPDAEVLVTRMAPDQVVAKILCKQGYSLFIPVSPICNTTSGYWFPSFDTVCCDIFQDGRWKKIFRYPAGNDGGLFGWWRSQNPRPNQKLVKGNCMYRNVSILGDWNGAVQIERARLNVIKDEQVVAFVVFDAVGSNNIDWFAKKRLIESSWDDLNPTVDIESFTSIGGPLYDSVVRFFIGKKISSGDCNDDVGWFVVTWHAYPCNSPFSDISQILYAPNRTYTHFSGTDIAHGDRFEVWVQES